MISSHNYLKSPPIASDDGITHINTQVNSKTELGQFLSLKYEMGDAINHPLIGPFRTVQNLWCFLNTGGKHDNLRTCVANTALYLSRLYDKYTCECFRDLIIDATLLKLDTRPDLEDQLRQCELPFDLYYVKGNTRIPIRPSYSTLFVQVLDDVRSIVRGDKKHRFVDFMELTFSERPKVIKP